MKKSKNSSCAMLGRDTAFPTESLLDKLCDAVESIDFEALVKQKIAESGVKGNFQIVIED